MKHTACTVRRRKRAACTALLLYLLLAGASFPAAAQGSGDTPSLADMADTLTLRHGKEVPREWREHGPGIVGSLRDRPLPASLADASSGIPLSEQAAGGPSSPEGSTALPESSSPERSTALPESSSPKGSAAFMPGAPQRLSFLSAARRTAVCVLPLRHTAVPAQAAQGSGPAGAVDRPFAVTENIPAAGGGQNGVSPQAEQGAVTVALTLDACAGKADTRIIALLRENRVPATLFVTNRWLRGNAALAADLAADPLFTLQAHGTNHKPASVNGRAAYGIKGTANIAELVEEVEGNARAIAAISGERPHWYRSGTAFYDEVALAVIRDLGLLVAGYSISADEGATLPGGAVARHMLAAKDGDIILCHMNHPESGTYAGLKEAIPKMLQAGVRFVGL